MENKNFINQSLWAGSSPNQTGETQSRENRIGVFSYFYRTFVLLFMLLTIGVGQMWADKSNNYVTFYVAVGQNHTHYDNDCRKFYSNIKRGNDDWEEIELTRTGYTYNGKTVYQGTHNFYYGGYNNWQFYIKDGSGKNQKYIEWYAGDWKSNFHNGQVWDWTGTETADKSEDHWKTATWDDSYIVYFARTSNWDHGVPYFYGWNGSCDNNSSWPGTQMNEVQGKTFNGKTIYALTVNKRYANCKFSNNGNNQTANMPLYGTNANKMYYYNGASDIWENLQYDVTLDQQEGSSGTNSIIATCGSSMPGSKKAPSRTGYIFGGYYTGTNGSGTQYYNADMTSAANWPADGSGPTTLYAKWTEITITELSASPSYGTTGSKTMTVSFKTNVPRNAGYYYRIAEFGGVGTGTTGGGFHLNGQAINSGSAETPITTAPFSTISFETSGIYTSAVEIYTDGPVISQKRVTFTYTAGDYCTVSFNMKDHGDAVEPQNILSGNKATEPSPAPTATGYTFGGWYENPECTGSAFDFSTPITVSRTLYAKWTPNIFLPNTHNNWNTSDENWKFDKLPGEVGNTVTLAVDINKSDYASSNYQLGFNIYHADWKDPWWHNQSNSDSYMFAHNCTDWGFNTKDGNYKTNLDLNVSGRYTFTLKNSNSYNEQKLSVTYPDKSFIEGDFPTEWSEDAYTLTEDGDIQSVTIDINSKGDKQFRLVSHGKLFGTSTKITAAANSQTLSAKKMTDEGAKMTLDAYVTGAYTFTYNKSTKNLTVTFPTAYRVTYGVGTDYMSMGGVSTTPNITSGDYVIEGREITFTATPNLGYKFVGWYSDEACTSSLSTDNPYTVSVTAEKTVYAKFELLTLYMNSDINNWESAIHLTHTADNPAVYTYTGTLNANPTTDPTTYATGWHFEYCYDEARNKRAYQYTTVQTLSPSGSSIDGVNTYAGANTIQFGLTKKSYITITLTLQEAEKPTVHIAADPYYTVTTVRGSNAVGITTISPESVEARSGANSAEIKATIAPGYTFDNWTAGSFITITSPKTETTTVKATGDGTLIANATPNHYTVLFNGNGNTDGSMQPLSALTFGETYNLPANAFTKTGYTFAGWATEAAGKVSYEDGEEVSNLTPVNNGTATLYAKWTPNQYTVTLKIDEEHHGSLVGEETTSQSVTYDEPTVTVPACPKGADGYALMGYYTDHNGAGTKLIDATGEWIASVDGYTDGSKNWVHDGDVTLYAYYKKAEITELEITPSIVALSATVTVVPTLAPKPDGETELCWRLLRSNDNEITGVTFSPTTPANAVSFTAPNASGTYKVACILRTGTVCGGGEVLDSVVQSFVVAGEHTVNVHYQDESGRTLSASTEVTGSPLEWSGDIAAPTITGYRFIRWEAGDGITIQDNETNSNPTHIKAAYDGDLTAIYSKKRMIYFNNTLGWSDVYVYFYENKMYWGYGNDANKGTGSNPDWRSQDGTSCPFKHKGAMTQIKGTNIWYYDCEANSVNASYTNVAFNENDQTNYDYFINTKVVRRGDYHSSLPMFVPLTGVDPLEMNNKQAKYYNEGYWMNYPENTGYTLKIYKSKTYNTVDELQSIPFEFTADKTLPMSLTVELNANREYGFEIHRADGTTFGNDSKVMKINDSGDNADAWVITSGKRTGVKTSVAGDYIFTLNFGNNGGYNYLVGVHYPVAQNDYRIVYTESGETLWSGHSKPAGWHHPSRSIEKKDGAKDIVSFYVSKADGANASMKFQYASAVDGEGNVTWTDVDGGSIDLSSITESGVYNFHLKQTNGSISVEKVEPYTGNYYIRTDNAGSTKWDNYRAADHQMTYSEFSKDRATNTFGELYTHYYMHWCPRGTNVKFCIANDYSSCITDTLVNDVVSLGNMADAGWLNRDNASEVYRDKFSANIRFMYDERTNKISRAYMSSSTNTDRKFLVLKSDTEFWNSDGTTLNGSGESAVVGNYEAIFKDHEDWIYEREIKLTPGQKFKLYASYAQEPVQEDGSQHFRGNYANNDWENRANYVELVGGNNDVACNARIIYDFKTNRLMSAYVPDNDNPIDGEHAINADIMIVRYHQEAGQQITFTNDGSLTDVKTVYGVMRFNRWILNNRQNPEDHLKVHCATDEAISIHHPMVDAGSMKSSDERGLYWISFPFDVNLSEVFGFGTYGTHWIIMTYNGEERAKQGFWADSEGFWEYIWDRRGVVLEKGKGYVLALELDLMQANDRTFWNNEIQQVELFFPSTTSSIGTIKETDVDIDVPAWQCTIDRTNSGGTSHDIYKNRTKVDSHWNIIGVPSYANYGTTLTDGGSTTITWKDNSALDWTKDLPFFYEWNANDNTYTVQSGTNYPFKAMHSYYVQYHGTLHWSLASATPASVASRTYAEAPRSEEFRLEFLRNDKMEDQTFVKLSDKANVSANFVFGEDMIKEQNATRANIYTIVENYLPVAGNTLPISEQTTVVPVGVKIKTAGDYTFSIPEGTDGIGVTLVDNETGVRTSLSALDYTVNLTAGTHDGRFVLEISPIQNTPTDIENIQGDNVQCTKVRKVMIDGILYIVKDGKIFDARGARVE